jgi:hypothetical protein
MTHSLATAAAACGVNKSTILAFFDAAYADRT